ncbi:hypothetical protein [Solirubrobacter soli]|uniref:hypothetical protein n=1 Tax=Solirubrobacter soli TaxID=363832 RepID=UPI0004230683|nr:hypothetical protein [Solirubrobacter soli]
MEPTRAKFRTLLAANPNYFGTAPGLVDFPVVVEQSFNTSYEALTCVSYSPRLDRLEATLIVKRPTGYAGDLCTSGSYEFVRFYIDYGSGWQDAGPAGVNVHDIPIGHDCHKDPTHPLVYVVGVDHQPRRDWCGNPVLPRVRAILSWNVMPPAGQPDWHPVWGDRHECNVQISPRRWFVKDVIAKLPSDAVKKLELPPLELIEVPTPPLPDPPPLPDTPIEYLAKLYQQVEVPPHRFALPHIAKTISASADADQLATVAVSAKDAGIELAPLLDTIDQTSGNTAYEELECLGLEHQNNADRLVATFNVKLPYGYSGPPCTAGSTEYVAFWADWDNDCKFEYLGTVETNLHDYQQLPKGGLCYAAVLPVDVNAIRKNCKTPVLRRVRAVLSWGAKPSTTDPNLLPTWGNRLDTHVQIAPGTPYDGTAKFVIVGGVATDEIDNTTGLTKPVAHLAVNGTPLDARGCPFAGAVVLHGPTDPALKNTVYRIMVTNTPGGTPFPLTGAFPTVTGDGHFVSRTPGPGGWTTWLGWQDNTTGVLGSFPTSGDAVWKIELELQGGTIADTRFVQLDNTLNGASVDPNNVADLELDTLGDCEVKPGWVTGRFRAADTHFRRWDIAVLGGPGGVPSLPTGVADPALAHEVATGGWHGFKVDLSALPPCGYVVQLSASDRAVVDSASTGRAVHVQRGLCLRP